MTTLPHLTDLEAGAVIGAVAVVGYLLSRWAGHRVRERGAAPASVRLVRVLFLVVTVLVGITVFVEFVGPISFLSGVAVSAVVGLAATLALQTTFANVISGFILLRNRMLRLNDTITVSGVTGQVVQLGLVTCWLRLPDGTVASVSNSTLLAGPMINRSAGERLKGEY